MGNDSIRGGVMVLIDIIRGVGVSWLQLFANKFSLIIPPDPNKSLLNTFTLYGLWWELISSWGKVMVTIVYKWILPKYPPTLTPDTIKYQLKTLTVYWLWWGMIVSGGRLWLQLFVNEFSSTTIIPPPLILVSPHLTPSPFMGYGGNWYHKGGWGL